MSEGTGPPRARRENRKDTNKKNFKMTKRRGKDQTTYDSSEYKRLK